VVRETKSCRTLAGTTMHKILDFLLVRSRFEKRIIQTFVDSILLIASIWISFSLRLGDVYPMFEPHAWLPSSTYLSDQYEFPFGLTDMAWLMLATPLIGIPIFTRMGLYRAIIRYLSHRAILTVIKAVLLYAVVWGFIAFFLKVQGLPRSVIIINAFIALVFIGGVRMLMRSIFAYFEGKQKAHLEKKTNILIFGAGNAGRQVAQSMLSGHEFHLCGFADDDRHLHGRELMGVSIIDPADIETMIKQCGLAEILLAIPSADASKRRRILERLRPYPVRVRTLPAINQIIGGKVGLRDMHELDLNDLLGRDPVDTDQAFLSAEISRKVVLVTGAGGTIGRELCRQVIRLRPNTLILFELNEYALYSVHKELLDLLVRIEEELSHNNSEKQLRALPRIIPILGSVNDLRHVSNVLATWAPSIIYHAAAYKHVPMVEHNAAEGIKNNVFGTLTIARAAIQARVPNFIFVSTDKAVRPTNIMGASKRLAEMLLQAFAHEKSIVFDSDINSGTRLQNFTHFSMVRFGNVLGSSGSVVPLFRKQIDRGGPLTLTDPEVTRYFMSIPEAAQLVLHAGALYHREQSKFVPGQETSSDIAEVFLLDMGEPVKIADLARRMIELSGLRVRDESNPHGDIEIQVTGLRPGEKLYEELLIVDNPVATSHPRIFKAAEDFLEWDDLREHLQTLEDATTVNDVKLIRSILEQLVSGYKPETQVSDWVYQERTVTQ